MHSPQLPGDKTCDLRRQDNKSYHFRTPNHPAFTLLHECIQERRFVSVLQHLWRSTSVGLILYLFLAQEATGQLTDLTQTTPQISGGVIGRSLADQVGAGQGDLYMPGSSIYLIKRDPARSIRRGRQIFQRKFTASQGLGPRVNADSTGDIQATPALGAGLVDSCAGCHGRPRGSAGFGGVVNTRPDSRDAPHLFGLGLIEMLADEITADLRQIRDRAIERAQTEGRPIIANLRSKSIRYGRILVLPDGTVDPSEIDGVDHDLRIRPFFAHGGSFSMREFIVGAFKDEMGLESVDPILCAATDPVQPQIQVSPAGFEFNPERDTFQRPPACDSESDADSDGVVNEIDPALIDHMEFYLLNYFKPGRSQIDATVRRGLRTFRDIGCTSCHVQNLTINQDRRVADVETQHDPQRGIFNRLYATAITLFETVNDGESYPLLLPQQKAFKVRNIFSDLKRHDLGPAFHERNFDGVLNTEFVTEPLWGVGTTAPYGHDGRSINLEEVILRHGGEATKAQRRFAALQPMARRAVITFLQSLILFPPDDTASNLNPGNPGTIDPQEPSEHGSINLGVLFQVDAEGIE